MTQQRICFIGGGNMGSAIVSGLEKLSPAPAITICDPSEAIQQLHQNLGRQTSPDASPVADADVIILAVKPQIADLVLNDLHSRIQHQPLVISIMAGITIAQLEAGLPPSCRIIRTMPNTPMAIGLGMVGLAAGSTATEADCITTEQLLGSAAKVLRIPEDKMNALTAISGSGPAYLFRFAEAQLAAAQDLGFTLEEAQLLVGTTLKGSIDYLLSNDGFPAGQLREQVTSPGGTTAAGLEQMNQLLIDDMMKKVFQAAEQRGLELAGK